MINMEQIKSIFHPTELKRHSDTALIHALRFSTILDLPFNVLHVGKLNHQECETAIFKMLNKWQLVASHENPPDLFKILRLNIILAPEKDRSLPDIVLDHLKQYSNVLLVMGTEGREGLPRWLNPSRAEEVARESHLPTVFVPERSNKKDIHQLSDYNYKRVLVPIDHKPDPQVGIQFAHQLASLSGSAKEIIIFHAGDILHIPQVDLPKAENYIWRKVHDPGDPVDKVIDTADEYQADLIIMSTAGHKGFMDALTGSVTEKVIRHASCPVIAVPAQ